MHPRTVVAAVHRHARTPRAVVAAVHRQARTPRTEEHRQARTPRTVVAVHRQARTPRPRTVVAMHRQARTVRWREWTRAAAAAVAAEQWDTWAVGAGRKPEPDL